MLEAVGWPKGQALGGGGNGTAIKAEILQATKARIRKAGVQNSALQNMQTRKSISTRRKQELLWF